MAAIRVADGLLVDPFNPTIFDIRLDVFAHSLSTINRYTGHTKHPYSVGQHTMNLRTAISKIYRDACPTWRDQLCKAALAHDMSEAWFNDLASPVKRECTAYKHHEHYASLFIMRNLGIGKAAAETIDAYDKAIYKNERNALFPVRLGEDGDDLTPLNVEYFPVRAFDEMHWRTTRELLWFEYRRFFPKECPEVPFWEKEAFNGK